MGSPTTVSSGSRADASGTHRGTRTFDRVVMGGYTICYVGLLVLAGLDAARFGLVVLDGPWVLVGGVLMIVGTVLVAGAMAVNRHLETTVRIQWDRGHEVASQGPYRLVRHPMYVGMIVQLPATALLLGSGLALVPASVCVLLLVVRTALEDRTLVRDLPGYAGYAKTTRYRLVPGIW